MSDAISKLKTNKKAFKIEYILVVVLIVLISCLFLLNSGFFNIFSSSNTTKSESYETELEEKLSLLISAIDGAGSVNVLITVDGSIKQEYLKNTTTKHENNVKVTEETTVLINGKPQLVKEYYPEVLGVVVICQGGENVKVKMAITEVITTLLPISSENIRILKKK